MSASLLTFFVAVASTTPAPPIGPGQPCAYEIVLPDSTARIWSSQACYVVTTCAPHPQGCVPQIVLVTPVTVDENATDGVWRSLGGYGKISIIEPDGTPIAGYPGNLADTALFYVEDKIFVDGFEVSCCAG